MDRPSFTAWILGAAALLCNGYGAAAPAPGGERPGDAAPAGNAVRVGDAAGVGDAASLEDAAPDTDTASPVAASEEVIVVEDRRVEPAETRMSAAEARQVPGALGDPVRAVVALPGVSPVGSGRPEIYLRGAPPGNTAYLLDGVRVPLLFHGGVASSVVPAALVDGLAVFASAAPARYGGQAGGVIELATAPPAARLHGEVTAKAYEAGALVESPLAGGQGSVLAAARLGYPQLVTAITSPDVHLSYWDYQARASWALGARDRITALALGSHDRLSEDDDQGPGTPSVEVERLASDFHRVDLRYEHRSEAGQLRAAVTGGWTAQGAGQIVARDASYGARLDGELRVAGGLRLRGGAQLQRDAYRISTATTDDDPSATSPARADPPPRNLVVGGYLDAVWDALDGVQLIPGLRIDAYHSERAASGASGTVPAIEPRLAARWRLRPGLMLSASAGLAHQLPVLRVGSAPATAISVPGFPIGDLRLQRSAQVSAGVEWLLPGAVAFGATGFASTTRDLSDLQDKCDQLRAGSPAMPGPTTYDCHDVRGAGTAYGVELSLRRPVTERIAGLVSYTLSRSQEEVSDQAGTHSAPSTYDRRHVASAGIAYQLTAGWRLGARAVAYSGAYARVPATPDGTPARRLRLPSFERVDLRAERRWQLADRRGVALVLDVLNATLSREQTGLRCTQNGCAVGEGERFIVPSVGLEGSF
jgi:hypothetical protein